MSSPNHPTSDIEDAFSSNFLDYIPASPDYSSASPGNTYSISSNNSFGLVPIALPTLSLFNDDPYMKAMHAYYAKELPIPPPTIVPLSSMLSPMFNPQEFFLLQELLPLKKRGRDRSSSSTSALPREFKIGESSKDKIEGLGKGRVIIQQDFDNLEAELREIPPKRTSTSEAPAMTQAAIRKLVADSVTAALEAQAVNMANTEKTTGGNQGEALVQENVTTKSKVSTGTLTEEALSWWNSFAQPIGIEKAHKITWGNDLKTYVRRFKELETLCPTMVPDSEKMIEVFIGGLPRSIKGNVTASKPQTLEEAINIAQRLMDQPSDHRTAIINATLKVICLPSDQFTCHACGEKGHYANQCQKTTNNNAQGRAYMLRDRNAHQDPNVVMGMFLLNQHLARVLFDSGADKSFVSISLASKLNIPPITIDTFYNIKMADGNLSSAYLDQKVLNMRQRRWLKLLADYNYEIRYHPGKENVIANALSRKEQIKPLPIRS
ncbi:reverse transcriptase domain-containing protein [Tanacetum coccineum]